MPADTKEVKTEAAAPEGAADGGGEKSFLTVDEFNKALSAQRARLEKSFDKRLEDREKAWEERFAAKPRDEEPKAATEADARIQALQKRLDDEVKARKAEADKREEEQRARARDAEQQALDGALRRAGIVDEDLLQAASSLLRGKVKHVNGQIRFATKDKYGDDSDTDVGEAIKAWAESPQGKKFVPASGAEGSGTRSNRGSQPGANRDAKGTAADAQAAIARLSGAVFGGGGR
jgi:hypothetical protein